MIDTIGVFVGSASSFNVIRVAKNVGRALNGEFTTHLIATDETLVSETNEAYDKVCNPRLTSFLSKDLSSLRSYLRSHKPDALFQITSPPIHGSIVGSLSQIYGIPFVYRYSGDRFYEYKLSRGFDKALHFGLNNVIGRYPLHLAESYVTLGPTGEERLRARGVDNGNISIIPPAVDQEKFSPSGPTVEFDTDRNVGLFVGRLSRLKGRETLERTLPRILDRRDDLHFVFVGRREESFTIPERYDDYITLVGPVSPEDVPRYFRAATFLIHPSLTEGMPRTVLEALASETPTIARDVGEIAYATENTFQTDQQFIEMVCNFESLEVDSVDRFLFENIEGKYRRLFSEL